MSAAAPASRTPAPKPLGEAGAWIFIFGDMFIFAMLFAAIVYIGEQHPAVFAESQALLNRGLGLLNTLVLLTGSIVVVRGTQLATGAAPRAALHWLSAGALCGTAFVLIKGLEYGALIAHGHWMHSNPFFMMFFVVTGAHLMHVLLGIAALMMMRGSARRGLARPRDRELFETGACYWHMVDLLWLVLFPMFYLVH